MKTSDILENLISLIPHQSIRFVVYSLLTIAIVQVSRLVSEEI